jgi:hypothetical protein
MRPVSRRYAVVATAALTLVLAACGSSNTTGPKTPTPQALATHFDSIYSAYLATGTSNDTALGRYIAEFFEVPPAYGASLSSFTVTTASGTQTWQGFTYEYASTGSSGDSTFLTVAFSDLNLSHFVVTTMNYNSGGFSDGNVFAVVNWTHGGFDSTFSGAASLLSTGATCSLQTGLAAGSYITSGVGASTACELAKFQVSFQATFAAGDSLGALSSMSISSDTFNGVRLSNPIVVSHVAPIPSKFAALGLRLSELPIWHTRH